MNNFHEYLIQHSLKSGGTKDHFRWVKVTALIERPVLELCNRSFRCKLTFTGLNSPSTLHMNLIFILQYKKNYFMTLTFENLVRKKVWNYCEFCNLDQNSIILSYGFKFLIFFCKLPKYSKFCKGPSWLCSCGSRIYNYLYKQCLSSLMLWVTTLCDKVCQWLATGRWFSPGTPVSSTYKTDNYIITEILLKVALNIIY